MRKRLATLMLVALFAVVGITTALPQKSYAASEALFNDGLYTFTVATPWGKRDVTPGGTYAGEAYYFTLYSWECASVSYNYGPWQRRGPGNHYFADGALIHIKTYRC